MNAIERTTLKFYNGFVHTAAGDIKIFFSSHDIERDNDSLIIRNAMGVNSEKAKSTTQAISLNDIKLPSDERREILKKFFDFVCLDEKLCFNKENIVHNNGRNIAMTKNFGKYYSLKSLNLSAEDKEKIKALVAEEQKNKKIKKRVFMRHLA